MSSNIQRLGDTLTDRMKQSASAAVPTTIELGVINGDMSLTTDSIKVPIPQGDYMVPLSFTHDTYYTYNEMNSTDSAPHVHDGGDHVHSSDGLHDHRVPSVFRGLEPGDRVLVAWVGHQPLVVDIFVSSDTTTPN